MSISFSSVKLLRFRLYSTPLSQPGRCALGRRSRWPSNRYANRVSGDPEKICYRPETATRAELGSRNLNTTINGGTGELVRVPE